jgi:TRAP-type C4-dicarboxylate transport system substrate-binding protein
MNFFKYTVLFLAGFSIFNFASAKMEIIKFATLAPQGSTWAKVMNDFSKEVELETKGKVKFKIYAGGVQGDEKDVIRKIRFKQLHAGGFTGVGLGIIAPHLRVLDAPFLFNTPQETDYIYEKFQKEFENYLSERGFILLGWAEVGFVYLFTNKPIRKLTDLSGVKMWAWQGDPIAEATFKNLKISAISLSITDVMTSLQTGLVDGVYGSALSVVALQWFSKIKYMFSLPIANASGAVLIHKKKFDKLTPANRKILKKLGRKYFRQLTVLEGISVTNPPDKKNKSAFELAGANARTELAGTLYPKKLLSRIEKTLREFRTKKSAKKKGKLSSI